MEDSNAYPQEEADNDLVGGILKSRHFFSREKVPDVFQNRRDLTTIQIRDTVLCRDGDLKEGAVRFIDLMKKMTTRRGPTLSYFEKKWLVSDPRQLRYVMRAIRERAPGTFGTLAGHATVAVVEPSNDFHRALENILLRFDSKRPQAITAFYSKQAKNYHYYGHFAPPTNQDWDNGSHCMMLDSTLNELDDILQKLQQAHVEKLTGHQDGIVKDLEKSGISILTLENLIQQA